MCDGGIIMKLPSLPRGRPSSSALAAFDAEVRTFCDLILEINSIELILGLAPGDGATFLRNMDSLRGISI
jgi:hypothetical protein